MTSQPDTNRYQELLERIDPGARRRRLEATVEQLEQKYMDVLAEARVQARLVEQRLALREALKESPALLAIFEAEQAQAFYVSQTRWITVSVVADELECVLDELDEIKAAEAKLSRVGLPRADA